MERLPVSRSHVQTPFSAEVVTSVCGYRCQRYAAYLSLHRIPDKSAGGVTSAPRAAVLAILMSAGYHGVRRSGVINATVPSNQRTSGNHYEKLRNRVNRLEISSISAAVRRYATTMAQSCTTGVPHAYIDIDWQSNGYRFAGHERHAARSRVR